VCVPVTKEEKKKVYWVVNRNAGGVWRGEREERETRTVGTGSSWKWMNKKSAFNSA
jgi:hypothetical protein